MSESESSVAVHGRRARHAADEPFVLPLWLINLVRRILRVVYRLLWRLRYEGLEHVPAAGPYLIAANHQTYFDPFWVGTPIAREMRYLAWDATLGWPLVGHLIGLLGAWPLQVEKSDTRTLRRALQWLRRGGVLVIFPEGGRALADGALLEFKPGAVRLALEAGVPILPVTIRGGHKVWPRDRAWPRFSKVEIIYHPPQHLQPLPGEDARACARRESERLTKTIASRL